MNACKLDGIDYAIQLSTNCDYIYLSNYRLKTVLFVSHRGTMFDMLFVMEKVVPNGLY